MAGECLQDDCVSGFVSQWLQIDLELNLVLSEFGVVFSGLSESCKNLQVTETSCGVVAKFRMQFSVLRHSPSSS
jgi:hypothetical protein